jgi:hypothetical protein
MGAFVQITFMPDPVCAALAMGLMIKDWKLKDLSGQKVYYGKTKTFWSQKAMDIFSKCLCIPEMGNLGKVMSALYMLFCGDMLRERNDLKLQLFSVSLIEWYAVLRNPSMDVPLFGCTGDTEQVRMDISFIQVCHNYLRGDGWNTTIALEWMYKAAFAIYMHPNSMGIDILASIRVIQNGIVSYHPLLVSVKCHLTFSHGEIIKEFKKMEELLMDVRQDVNATNTSALCLLLLIGRTTNSDDDKYYEYTDYNNNDLGDFPNRDKFRLIVVSTDDSFDIHKAVHQVMFAQEKHEVYSSHPYVYWYPYNDTGNITVVKKLLHSDATAEAVEYTKKLLIGLE